MEDNRIFKVRVRLKEGIWGTRADLMCAELVIAKDIDLITAILLCNRWNEVSLSNIVAQQINQDEKQISS